MYMICLLPGWIRDIKLHARIENESLNPVKPGHRGLTIGQPMMRNECAYISSKANLSREHQLVRKQHATKVGSDYSQEGAYHDDTGGQPAFVEPSPW